jgi:hypothetical protein
VAKIAFSTFGENQDALLDIVLDVVKISSFMM